MTAETQSWIDQELQAAMSNARCGSHTTAIDRLVGVIQALQKQVAELQVDVDDAQSAIDDLEFKILG